MKKLAISLMIIGAFAVGTVAAQDANKKCDKAKTENCEKKKECTKEEKKACDKQEKKECCPKAEEKK